MTLFRGSGGDLPLMPWLEERIWPVEAKLDAEDVYWGARLACAEMIRTGTTRFWDMYWQPEATARAVADAGMRATIGAPLFDARRRLRASAQQTRAEQPRARWAQLGRRSPPPSPRTRSTWSARLRCAGSPSSPPSARCPVHIHLSETEAEVDECLAAHGLRPAAYLDELGLLERAHRARPRRLARPRGAGADRGARRHRRRQPGRQHEARGRRRLPLPGGARRRGRGRARHRRRRLQRLARPARRPEALRPAPRSTPPPTRPRSPPPRPGRSPPAPGRRCCAAPTSRSRSAPPPTSSCSTRARPSWRSASSPPTSSTPPAAPLSTPPSSPAGC